MRRFRISYQYGTYSGETTERGDDGEHAIARMWSRFNRQGYLTLGMAYRSARVVEEL